MYQGSDHGVPRATGRVLTVSAPVAPVAVPVAGAIHSWPQSSLSIGTCPSADRPPPHNILPGIAETCQVP